jgi:hypothetical protein
MVCPKCGGAASHVLVTRITRNPSTLKRRRKCDACEFRFTTIETYAYENPAEEPQYAGPGRPTKRRPLEAAWGIGFQDREGSA